MRSNQYLLLLEGSHDSCPAGFTSHTAGSETGSVCCRVAGGRVPVILVCGWGAGRGSWGCSRGGSRSCVMYNLDLLSLSRLCPAAGPFWGQRSISGQRRRGPPLRGAYSNHHIYGLLPGSGSEGSAIYGEDYSALTLPCLARSHPLAASP